MSTARRERRVILPVEGDIGRIVMIWIMDMIIGGRRITIDAGESDS
jgi:hypothetical protein